MGGWVTTPFSVRQSAGFAFQAAAAAATSIARAVAPAVRSCCQAPRTLELPPVSSEPKSAW